MVRTSDETSFQKYLIQHERQQLKHDLDRHLEIIAVENQFIRDEYKKDPTQFGLWIQHPQIYLTIHQSQQARSATKDIILVLCKKLNITDSNMDQMLDVYGTDEDWGDHFKIPSPDEFPQIVIPSPAPPAKHVGEIIRSITDAQGLTATQAAKKVGMSRASWYRVLSGELELLCHHALAIETALGIQASALLLHQLQNARHKRSSKLV